MDRIFLIISITAFIAFVVGLINPGSAIFWSKNKTKIKVIVYLIIFVVFGIIWLLVRWWDDTKNLFHNIQIELIKSLILRKYITILRKLPSSKKLEGSLLYTGSIKPIWLDNIIIIYIGGVEEHQSELSLGGTTYVKMHTPLKFNAHPLYLLTASRFQT